MSTTVELLETLMRLKGLSQAGLALKAGLHRSNLCRLLAGEIDIRMSSLQAVLGALGISLDDFLKDEIRKQANEEPKPKGVGDAFEAVLKNSDPITRKTLLSTVTARASLKNPDVADAVRLLNSYNVHSQPERVN